MTGWLDPANYGPHSRQWLGHYFRYYLARGFLEPEDMVVDAASGVGYGTLLMADACATVVGVDCDEKALEIARAKRSHDRVRYYQVDLDEHSTLPLCDVVVSFETIEHLERPEHFADLIRGCAKRLIILSAPVIPTVGINPHHKTDFTEESLQALVLQDDWTLYEFIRQGPYGIVIAYRK